MNGRVARVAVLLTVVAVATFTLLESNTSSGSAIAETQSSAPESLLGVFEGRTPCGVRFVDFTGYSGPSCEKMKWWLALYHDESGRPTRYEFKGTRATRTGRWSIERGAGSNRDAVVYRLATDLPVESIALLRADENVLLLLDRDLRLMVGDASWSYTLSRTK